MKSLLSKFSIALLFVAAIAGAQSTYDGLTIPSSHPRLGGFSDPARLAAARTWFAAQTGWDAGTGCAQQNGNTELSCLKVAFAHLMTANQTPNPNSCSAAITWGVSGMSQAVSQGNGDIFGDNASNDMNTTARTQTLIYDWCYDQFTSGQLSTYLAGGNIVFGPYLGGNDGGTLPSSGNPDGPTMEGLQNNLRSAYDFAAFDWGVASYWENTSNAQQNLDEFFNHYWNYLTPYLATTVSGGGSGGVSQEGTNYGIFFYSHAAVPLFTAKALGRDLAAETNFYKEAPFALIYGTTPAPTYTPQFSSTMYGMFCWADGHCGEPGYDFLQDVNGYLAVSDVATFAANEYASTNVGKYARTWVNSLSTQLPAAPWVQAIDSGGSALAYSSLPLDYYAPGAGFFWLRKAWDSSSTMVKLGLNSLSQAQGHPGQNATGNWEMWRGGQWMSRNTGGYAQSFTGWNSTGSIDGTRTADGNGLLVNPDNQGCTAGSTCQGDGGLYWLQQVMDPLDSTSNGDPLTPAQTIRLESQPGYAYAATDTTGAYYPGGYGAGTGTTGSLNNPAVNKVIREFVWVRDLETLVVFDRVNTLAVGGVAAGSIKRSFLAHCEINWALVDANHATCSPGGSQVLNLTTLLPATPSPAYHVTNESTYGGVQDSQYRLEVNDTPGAAQSYFAHVLQSRASSGTALTPAITDNGTSYTINLDSTHSITFQKGAASSGGSITLAGATTNFTSSVESISVTDAGPVWGSSAPTYTLSTATAGAGSGTIGGCAGSYASGAAYSCTVAAGSGSTLASVSGCGGAGTTTYSGTMPASNCTVTATFNLTSVTYALTVTSSTNGTITGANCASGTEASGTSVSCMATPSTGYTFAGWSGGTCSGTTNPCAFTLGGNDTVTASFNPTAANYVLTVTTPANGTVNGTNCASGTYAGGTGISCTATPNIGYAFAGWSGGTCSGTTNPCAFTLSGNGTVTAAFNLTGTNYNLTVSSAGTGTGTVSGTHCSSGSYAGGTSVSCTAAPGSGSTFAGWSGACSGTGACSFSLSANSTVTAKFNLSTSALSLGLGTCTSTMTGTQYVGFSGCTLAASGGTPPYTYSWVAVTDGSYAALPEGLSLGSSTGTISGTVYGQGRYVPEFKVTDGAAATATLSSLVFSISGNNALGGCSLFPSDSIFHQRVDSLPVDASPAAPIYSGYQSSTLRAFFGNGGDGNIPNGIPMIQVPYNQANVTVTSSGGTSYFTSGPIPTYALPEGTSNNSGDRHVLVLQTAGGGNPCRLWEMYQGVYAGTWQDVGNADWSNLGSTGTGAYAMPPQDTGTTDAAGLPVAPLLVNADEVIGTGTPSAPNGSVQHPIRFTVTHMLNRYVWPATAHAGSGTCSGGYSDPNSMLLQGAGAPASCTWTGPAGEIYRLKASVATPACAATSPQAAIIIQGLRNYGIILADNGQSGGLIGTPDARWNDSDLACLTSLTLSNFEPVNVSGVAAVLTPNNFGTGYSAPVTSYQTTSGALTLTGITVTPASASIMAGTGIQQYAAQCTYSNSTNSNCTSTVTWSSSNPSAATISSSGLASGVAAGSATITASSGSIAGSGVLTVSAATLTGITVTPASASIMAGTGIQQYAAQCTYSNSTNANCTSTVTWSSSNPSAATISSGGLASGVAAGSANITASLGSITGSGVLTVSAATLTGITVTPATASIMAGTGIQQYAAQCTYSNSTNANCTSTVTWSSSNPSAATISSSGLASGVAAGSATIKAVSGSITGSSVLTVSAPTLTGITVTPASASIVAGTGTQQYAAQCTYSNSTNANCTSTVTWSSSNPSAATISSGGLASGVAAGSATIKAVSGSITGSSVLTVTSPTLTGITVTPATASIVAGTGTQQYAAQCTYSNSTNANCTSTVTWSSSNPSIATISSGGLASGVAAGSTNIKAVSGSIAGSGVLTVSAPTLTGITVTPSTASIVAGTGTQQYAAQCTYSNSTNANCTSTVTWSSSNPSIATISSGGLASGVAAGSTNITASSGSITGSGALTVTSSSLTGITVTPATASITAGSGTQQYAAQCTYSNKSKSDCTSTVTWSSSNPAAATISSSGLAIGVAVGSATINATSSGSLKGNGALTVKFSGKPVKVKGGEWAWMGGNSTTSATSIAQVAVDTASGAPSSGNIPGGREAFVSWSDGTGTLWLFGGGGFDSAGVNGYLNDLWQFVPSTQDWAWMGGSATVPGANMGQPGVYGTLGTSAAANTPGGREASVGWTDKAGNLWLFGGAGSDSGGTNGSLNDVWKLVPSTQEWAWMGGSSTVPGANNGQPGVYGDLSIPGAGNIPGGRWGANGWTDGDGNLWLFGGQGYDSAGSPGSLNDLWELNPSTGNWAWMGGSSTVGSSGGQAGAYGSFGNPSTANVPSGRSQAVSWIDSTGNFWILGGEGYDSTGTLGYLNDLWEFNPSTREWAWMGGNNTVGCAGCGMSGIYGTLGEADPANIPGGRNQAVGWTDSNGNFWLFGGTGYDSAGTNGTLNDLWEFSPSTLEWAWMGGSATVPGAKKGHAGAYGHRGVPDAGDAPGSRWGTGGWTDSNGNLWMFGGTGYDSLGNYDNLNDLWVYQPSPGSLPAATPTLGIAAGTYNTTQTVTITDATPGATIYYTTDGETPSAASSVYSGPITVSSTMTIEAIAAASGYKASAVSSANYTIIPFFSIASRTGSATQVTVPSGGLATYSLVVTPMGSATFPAAITLTASGLPPGSTAAFTPGAVGAGLGTTNVSLSIQTSSTSAAIVPGRSNWTLALGLLLFLPLAGIRRWRAFLERLSVGTRLLAGILILAGMTLAFSGCAGSVTLNNPGSGSGASTPTAYTVTVTAASGEVHQTTTVTVTVQ